LRVAALSAALLAAPAQAQDRPLRLLVPMPPGAALDLVARVAADRIRVSTGRVVVTENMGGAAGHIAAELLKKSAPDGNTVMIVPMAMISLHPHTYKTLRYDPFTDFAAVAQVAQGQIVFAVHAAVPAATLADYLALVKKDPNRGNYGSPSAGGSLPHFFVITMAGIAGVEMTHVPYKGSAPMSQALARGEISAGITGLQDLGRLAKAGQVRLLAVAGAKRSLHFPQVPTLRESGFDLDGAGWYGLYAPAKTPTALVERLSKAVIDAVGSKEMAARLQELMLEPTGLGAADMERIARRDYERWGPVVKAAGFAASQ
jgi:tripartite-type tricarboxylate transporter receptor subunit TctC